MGTSTSSKGSPSGVPFDPPWISDMAHKIAPEVVAVEMPVSTSSAARFGGARRKLSEYIGSGHEASLKSSIARYVKRGLGGSAQATSRLKLPIAASVSIWSTLQDLLDREGAENEESAWITRIITSENQIVALEEELIRKIVPDGGTIDEESCKRSLAFALSEFEKENPEVDVEHYHEESIVSIIELFLSREIFNRYILDMGQRLERMEISEMPRIEKEIMGYIRASMHVKIKQKFRIERRRYTRKEMMAIVNGVMRETFDIFGEIDDE